MSASATSPPVAPPARWSAVLEEIAAGAERRDRCPAFPHDAFRLLADAGALGLTLGGPRGERDVPFSRELALLRAVASADGSVGRILDGHLNAVERLTVSRPGTLDGAAQVAIASGELLLGVWGADPVPEEGEGEPAVIMDEPAGLLLRGSKTFCSGAGGVDRALVVARDESGARRLAYVDVRERTQIDRSWYRASGLRASESHRVQFDGAPVLAVLGGPDEMGRQPWFARDAIRTSATWAGMADGLASAALEILRARGSTGELLGLAAGQIRVAQGTIDRWLDHAGSQVDRQGELGPLAIDARYAIATACREISAVSAESCGSRPLAVGGALSRTRRDLDLFLLQHRLDPLLARRGAALLDQDDR